MSETFKNWEEEAVGVRGVAWPQPSPLDEDHLSVEEWRQLRLLLRDTAARIRNGEVTLEQVAVGLDRLARMWWRYDRELKDEQR